MTAFVWRALGGLFPGTPSAGDELRQAIRFLGWSVSPGTVVSAGYTAGLLAALVVVPLVLVAPPGFRTAVLACPLVVGLGVIHGVHRVPVWLATARRTAALGDAPGIVGRAVLRMRVAPTAESAAEFAASTGEGPLAASLTNHVRRAAGTPRSGLSSFADEWVEWFPALRRSTGLVVAAADAPPGERARTLDRAMSAVLEGTRDRLASFVADVRGPATALYAFGVLLPLALVAVLPAARLAGIPASVGLLVVVYDLLLPVVTLAVTGWLLLRRPVAFPPPAVDRSHPDVPDHPLLAAIAGASVGLAALVAGPRLFPGWTTGPLVVGTGIGTALVFAYRPIASVRSHVRSVEEGLPDAMYLVGRRVAEGEAVETAIERAAHELPGATGDCLAEAAGVGRRLRVGVRASLLGEHGALATVPSLRARTTADLLAIAAREGEPAGGAIVAMADHLADLQSVEREARRELARVTDTLRQTAALFGPLVAGATVALAEGMRSPGGSDPGTTGLQSGSTGGQAVGVGASGGSTLPAGELGIAVGAYVLFLSVVLTVLAVGLERGLDRALVGYRAGIALCSATVVYLGTYLLVGAVV